MKNISISFLIIILIISVLCADSVIGDTQDVGCISQNYIHADNEQASHETGAKRDLLALMMGYPGHIKGIEEGEDGFIYVVMESGNKILYDDRKDKSYGEKLAAPDLQDTMEMLYPIEEIDSLLEGDFDPGRIRSYELLKEVYGTARENIERNLSGAALGPRNCLFNKNNGALKAIEEVFKNISDICANDASVYGFVYPLNGTYNYRFIEGTQRLSPHSFGIAIDLEDAAGDYWRWASRQQGLKRLASYPREIVRAFEDNGFIWGGKWAHFDILHFEYRPEIIIKARHYKEPRFGQAWYWGFPKNDDTEQYIDMIDKAFKED